jgi:hypothetical protein
MTFDKDFIRGIDLSRAAIDQYGAGTTVRAKGGHAWDWEAVLPNGTTGFIDMNRAALKQYNSTAKPVMTGVAAGDWAFLDFGGISYKVIPIMLVTADKIYDVNAVKTALDAFESKIIACQEWMRQQLDKTFDVVQPLTYYTPVSANQFQLWDNQRISTGSFNYFYGVRDEIKRMLGTSYNEQRHVYLVTVLGGIVGWSCNLNPVSLVRSEVLDDHYKVFTEAVHTQDGDVGDDSYMIMHELTHAFGVDHTPESTVNRHEYLMWTGRLPNAKLTSTEKSLILKSPFIK